MSVPTTMEEFKALGVVTCPHCRLMLDATDERALLEHMNSHPEVLRDLQLNLFLNDMCNAGILRRVDKT